MADPSEFENLWAQYVSEIKKVNIKRAEDATKMQEFRKES